MLKKIKGLKPRNRKKIIVACIALHNYIRDTKLREKEFDRCDADENCIAPRATPVLHDRAPYSLNIVNMKDVHDRIANAFYQMREEE
jgi:hypothetical protein